MNSVRRSVILVVACLSWACGAAGWAASPDEPFWLKSWTVASIEGSKTDQAALAPTIGMHIILQPDHVVDPLAEDCSHGVSYADVQSRPVAELRRHFGAFWQWPRFPRAVASYGWVRCGGSNVGAFAFVSATRAYLFYEGGSIIVLR